MRKIISILLLAILPAFAFSGANTDRLNPNESLTPGQSIISNNGYKFILQGDGNLVVYDGQGAALWGSNTQGRTDVKNVIMQGDGNLVIYTQSNKAIWASNTQGRPGAGLVLQGDGNVVIYQNGVALWATGTNGKGRPSNQVSTTQVNPNDLGSKIDSFNVNIESPPGITFVLIGFYCTNDPANFFYKAKGCYLKDVVLSDLTMPAPQGKAVLKLNEEGRDIAKTKNLETLTILAYSKTTADGHYDVPADKVQPQPMLDDPDRQIRQEATRKVAMGLNEWQKAGRPLPDKIKVKLEQITAILKNAGQLNNDTNVLAMLMYGPEEAPGLYKSLGLSDAESSALNRGPMLQVKVNYIKMPVTDAAASDYYRLIGQAYINTVETTNTWVFNPNLKALNFDNPNATFKFPDPDFIFKGEQKANANRVNPDAVIKAMKEAISKGCDNVFPAQLFDKNYLATLPNAQIDAIIAYAAEIITGARLAPAKQATLTTILSDSLCQYKDIAAILVKAAIAVVGTIITGGGAFSLIKDLANTGVELAGAAKNIH